jgi:hypothetical protein
LTRGCHRVLPERLLSRGEPTIDDAGDGDQLERQLPLIGLQRLEVREEQAHVVEFSLADVACATGDGGEQPNEVGVEILCSHDGRCHGAHGAESAFR